MRVSNTHFFDALVGARRGVREPFPFREPQDALRRLQRGQCAHDAFCGRIADAARCESENQSREKCLSVKNMISGIDRMSCTWAMVPTEARRNLPYVEGVDLIVHAPKR